MIGHILTHPIRADHDDDSLIVYQAYKNSIGKQAAIRNTLDVTGFSRERMTWIKPSFLWMMYRSGWGKKDIGQSTILKIRMNKSEFYNLLQNSVLSHFDPSIGDSHEEWKERLTTHPNRIQWDPDRDIYLKSNGNRAIQVGISPKFLDSYLNSIIEIKDITNECTRLYSEIASSQHCTNLPVETIMLDVV